MSQPPINDPYRSPGQPGQPGQDNQYGRPGSHGQAAQPGPPAQYGQVGTGQMGYDQSGQPSWYGQHPGAYAQYGQSGVSQPGNDAPGGPQAMSSAPQPAYQPSQSAPIPVEQDRVVLKPGATMASRIQMLVAGGFGLVCLAAAVKELIGKGATVSFVVLLLLGLLTLFGVLFLMSMRTVLDATGIHVGAGGRGRDISWPRSRTGLFVKVSGAPAALSAAGGKPQIRHAEAHVIDTDGKAIALTGLTWSGISGEALERKGTAELDRIWQWAVARGYTQETGDYVELGGVIGIQQGARARQERRQGLRP